MDSKREPAPVRSASATAALAMCREAKVEATIPAQMAWDLAQYVRQLEVAAGAVPAAEYMRGPRGMCVQVVGVDTGEE